MADLQGEVEEVLPEVDASLLVNGSVLQTRHCQLDDFVHAAMDGGVPAECNTCRCQLDPSAVLVWDKGGGDRAFPTYSGGSVNLACLPD